MPIYEYVCRNCKTKSSVLVRGFTNPPDNRCPACGGKDMARVISRVAYHKSTQTVWEESGEPKASPGMDYYKDPRNIGRWTEKRFKEMGVDLPAGIKEEIQAAREGELPSSLKEKL